MAADRQFPCDGSSWPMSEGSVTYVIVYRKSEVYRSVQNACRLIKMLTVRIYA